MLSKYLAITHRSNKGADASFASASAVKVHQVEVTRAAGILVRMAN